MPSDISGGGLLLRVDENLHSFVIKRIWLAEVEYTKSDFSGLAVTASEEIPLSMPDCINVIL